MDCPVCRKRLKELEKQREEDVIAIHIERDRQIRNAYAAYWERRLAIIQECKDGKHEIGDLVKVNVDLLRKAQAIRRKYPIFCNECGVINPPDGFYPLGVSGGDRVSSVDCNECRRKEPDVTDA